MNNTVNQFKTICTLEGISAIALFFFAMPMKYIWEQPQYVKTIGMLHGILFIAYILWASMVKPVLKWTFWDYMLVCICSIPPGATFWVEYKFLKRKQA